MPEPLVSVAIPVYNGRTYIRDCLDSVVAAWDGVPKAERSRVEVVVCDNWSDDGTPDAVAAFAETHPIRLVRPEHHCPNRTDNWNHAIRSTSAEWVQMLHADDLMCAGTLVGRLHAVGAAGASSAVMVAARHRTLSAAGGSGGLRPMWRAAGILNGRRIVRHVLPYHCPFVPFTLFRRSTFDNVGGFDPQWELVQDWDLWSRMLATGDLLYDPHEAGMWRLHPVSPHYLDVFAAEHRALAALLPGRTPGLSRTVARRAARVHDARAAVLSQGPKIRAHDRLQVRTTAWITGVKMNALRAVGSVRLKHQDIVPAPHPGDDDLAKALARAGIAPDPDAAYLRGYELPRVRAIQRALRTYVESPCPAVLDVGYLDGLVPFTLRKLDPNLRLACSERDEVAAAKAAAKAFQTLPGVPIHALDLTGPTTIGQRFDVVILGEILEHISVANLPGVLRTARRLLVYGGILIITTPNLHGLAMRVRHGLGADFTHDPVLHATMGLPHINLLSARLICDVGRSTGFRVAAVEYNDFTSGIRAGRSKIARHAQLIRSLSLSRLWPSTQDDLLIVLRNETGGLGPSSAFGRSNLSPFDALRAARWTTTPH